MSDSELDDTQQSQTQPTDQRDYYIFYRDNQYVIGSWVEQHRTGAGQIVSQLFQRKQDAAEICYLLNGCGHDSRMVAAVKALLARARY